MFWGGGLLGGGLYLIYCSVAGLVVLNGRFCAVVAVGDMYEYRGGG
jgi:hypothetical protein